MTREQAINYLISSGFSEEQVSEVVRALTYEPTTKNDLGVDCISRQAVEDITWQDPSYSDPLNVLTEVRDKIRELPSVTPQLSSGLEKNSKKLEKDFDKLDCISRADAIKAMQDKAKKLTNEDTINGLCGAVAILFDLPSVTPQEPKTGHWIEKDGYDGDTYYDCSVCGESWTTIEGTPWNNGMRYCPNCGAKMVEPRERSSEE